MVIHKFQITGARIVIPNFKSFAHFDEQNGLLYVWAVVRSKPQIYDYDNSAEFELIATGQTFDSHWKHVQSLVDHKGFVWHLMRVR